MASIKTSLSTEKLLEGSDDENQPTEKDVGLQEEDISKSEVKNLTQISLHSDDYADVVLVSNSETEDQDDSMDVSFITKTTSVSSNKVNRSKINTKVTEDKLSTPKIVLQKVGTNNWKNSSISKHESETTKIQPRIDSDQSSSPTDETDSDFEFQGNLSNFNRSTRSTRSSVNNSKSDISVDTILDIDKEAADADGELMHLERLQAILAKQSSKSAELLRSNSVPSKLSRPKPKKNNKSLNRSISLKPAAEVTRFKPVVRNTPKIIDRGPIDCFDSMIVETTAGFPCTFCSSKKFKKRREMINHLQTQHDEKLSSEQKNRELSGLFPCDECDTAFYSKFILRTHKKAHKKGQADSCDKYYHYYLKFGKA